MNGPVLARAARFVVIFAGLTVVMAAMYEAAPGLLAWVYLAPVTHAACAVARLAGVELLVDWMPLAAGYCELAVADVTYIVSQACTGLFTCSLYVAACLAYPVPVRDRLIGVALGVPAFMTFGALRLLIMIVVALLDPARIEVFHTYIMTIANLGFALFVWTYWLQGPLRTDHAGAGHRPPVDAS